MKSYLGLVSEYAKVHRKKNRLTGICIAISVMLVTAIFGMADMSIKAQMVRQSVSLAIGTLSSKAYRRAQPKKSQAAAR